MYHWHSNPYVNIIVDEEESDDDAGAEIELGSDDRLVFFNIILYDPNTSTNLPQISLH